ncbi:leucine-rich repeat and IQ domain-containing protein 3 [Nycticebus coucang]|uniref:leucine-rich repeat and IQ domain-containing protein 3 n=1 Tax=Nycticebus coucang TaxID=9470 RepID=UPI00234D7162|nr:leucine-rich repeat and IQ domain-containing protein 3 [Nycticebus coucang]
MFHGTIREELISHEEWSHYNENIIEDQKDFVFVKFSGLHLKSMESFQSCISLRVCIFSNNFITDIHPLQSCTKLIKLDLHGNQIKLLPNTKFWSGLKNLKLLYLHDNGFSKLKNICVLSACSNLIALTMFDCPVSLKKGYRHVLVNSVWSLKALDCHVISDEEIIQNWHLPERFKTCNHRLFFNFCPALRKGATYEDEINNVTYVISKINKILAHNSPVLIVQRWIRGFLVRRKLSPFFVYKKREEKTVREFETKWIFVTRGYEDMLLKDIFSKSETHIKGKLARWKHNVYPPVDFKNYSEYIKHVPSILYELKTKDIGMKSPKSRHLIQKGEKESKSEIKDQEVDTSFRISVVKLPIYTSSPLKYAEIVKEKKKDFFPAYARSPPVIHPKPIIKKDTLLETRRKEFFATHRVGMRLQTLRDIDKYYTEQKNQRLCHQKGIAVTVAQIAQERNNVSVQENLSNKKYAVQKRTEKHKETVRNGLQQLQKDKLNYLEKVTERRALFLKENTEKAAQRFLVQSLNNGRTLLAKRMRAGDRLKEIEAVQKEKTLAVQQKRKAEKYRKNLLKQMKEYRAKKIYKTHCEEEFVNNMIAFQKACERSQEIKTRVTVVKTGLAYPIPSEMRE